MYQFWFPDLLTKEKRFESQTQESFRNSQLIAIGKGSNLSCFFLLWLKFLLSFSFQSKNTIEKNEKRGAVFQYCVFWDTIQSIEEMDPTLHKKISSEIPARRNFFIYFYFVLFWRHGRVVRRGTANPFSPVQIRVPPD